MSWLWDIADPAPEESYCCLHLVLMVDGSCPVCRNSEQPASWVLRAIQHEPARTPDPAPDE